MISFKFFRKIVWTWSNGFNLLICWHVCVNRGYQCRLRLHSWGVSNRNSQCWRWLLLIMCNGFKLNNTDQLINITFSWRVNFAIDGPIRGSCVVADPRHQRHIRFVHFLVVIVGSYTLQHCWPDVCLLNCQKRTINQWQRQLTSSRRSTDAKRQSSRAKTDLITLVIRKINYRLFKNSLFFLIIEWNVWFYI